MLLETLPKKENDVVIDYPRNTMINFFKIHYNFLKEYELIKLTSLVYRWSKFVISFVDEDSEYTCLNYLKQRKQSEKGEVENG